MASKSLVLLAGPGGSTPIMYNALKQNFYVEKVILEEAVPRSVFVRRRIKRLGIVTVAGQILFSVGVSPWIEKSSQVRMVELKSTFNLDESPIPEDKTIHVSSVNQDDARLALEQLDPDLVVINGTRIISETTLKCINANFVNVHAGITPLYRGVHGAYWALRQQQPEACGVTVHLVDKGIDTGGILAQALIQPTEADNFSTYPLMQLGTALPKLKQSIENVLAGNINTLPTPEGASVLWSHPTAWGYVWHRFRHNVK